MVYNRQKRVIHLTSGNGSLVSQSGNDDQGSGSAEGGCHSDTVEHRIESERRRLFLQSEWSQI